MAPAWDPVDMEKAAFHEAGHAVVLWALGVPLARIYLNLETEGGETVPGEPTRPLCIVQQIAFQYAGPVSEQIFKGPASSHRCLGDHVNVNILLERNGTPEEEPEGQAFQKRAYAWVENLLRRHEARIERVAKRLLQPPHKLNPARFKQLMREG